MGEQADNKEYYRVMKQKLLIHSSSEAFNLTPERIVYFMADGNYSNVHLSDGNEFLLSFQLGQIENIIREQLSYTHHSFVRVGKSLIVNTERILHINLQKQVLMMESENDDKVVLSASREALKKMMNMLIESNQKSTIKSVTINAPKPIKGSGQSMLRVGKLPKETISDTDIRIILK